MQQLQIVVGIDVGGEKKGFHAVALRGKTFKDKIKDTDPAKIRDWCIAQGAVVVAVDAPCGWSRNDSSRLAESELSEKKIYCFATPTRCEAERNEKNFYEWVFNGEKLYRLLENNYPLFKGERLNRPVCIETFPNAIIFALEGPLNPSESRVVVRRRTLTNRGYDIRKLSNIDFVDAALCAVAADEFRKGNYQCFGNSEEGIIVLPGKAPVNKKA